MAIRAFILVVCVVVLAVWGFKRSRSERLKQEMAGLRSGGRLTSVSTSPESDALVDREGRRVREVVWMDHLTRIVYIAKIDPNDGALIWLGEAVDDPIVGWSTLVLIASFGAIAMVVSIAVTLLRATR